MLPDRPQQLLLCFLLFAFVASAQVRYHFGDDLRWAAPDLNEKDWTVSSDGTVPPSHASDGMLWARKRIVAPETFGEPGAVMWPADCGADELAGPGELYLNGVRIAVIGKLPPRPEFPFAAIECVFAIPPGLVVPGKSALIAVRTWTGEWGDIRRASVSDVTLGRRDLLDERARALRTEHRLAALGDIGLGILSMLIGTAVWMIWRFTRGDRLLFWAGNWLNIAGLGLVYSQLQLTWWANLSTRFAVTTGIALFALTLLVLAELLWAAYDYPRSRRLLLTDLLLTLPCWVIEAVFLSESGPRLVPLVPVAIMISGATMLALVFWGLRKGGDARLIASGLLVFTLWIVTSNWLNLPRALWVGVFQLHYGTLSMTTFSIAVAGILVRRTWLRSRRADRLNAEINAAREIQSALIPAECPQIPGFETRAAYIPAEEVGGDFYQVLPCNGGASLVVVGDVSGKGLKAAMVVSMIAGMVQAELKHTSDPARILSHINAVLTGQLKGGFVTCCCLRLERNGDYTIANAAHVAPYAGGRAVMTEPGLPLGITTETTWENSGGVLEPGETLVLISDGVLEARRPSGELYGFERVEADMIRFQNPADLARRAQQFGQEDDITVVSITRHEAGVHAA